MIRIAPIVFLIFIACTNEQVKGPLGKFEISIYPDDTVNSGEDVTIRITLDDSVYSSQEFKPKWAYFGDTFEIRRNHRSFGVVEIVDVPQDSVIIRSIPITIILGPVETDVIIDTINYSVNNIETSPRTSGKLNNNLKIGQWKFYYDTDKLKLQEISEWNENVRNGKTERFFESGKLSNVMYYSNGIPDGRWEIYDTSGKLNFVNVYDNGKHIETIQMD